ncbi:MAG: DUF1080 domain-containing protein [Lentisphaeraceae bacterium]|nr:DUF1080 domain-containing protein [Lentisphaeraceae bacterium]
MKSVLKQIFVCAAVLLMASCSTAQKVGVGAPVPSDAEVVFDGSREMLDAKWTYWESPRFASSLPIKWKVIDDPLGDGTIMMTDDPNTPVGKYGTSDIVTKKKYKDFRLHIEFLIKNKGGNSGVYLQNRFEIQVLDSDKTKHGMGAVINETESPYHLYKGLNQWNSYDIVFKAARFKDGKMTEKPRVTVYFNGVKAHTNQLINQIWGGENSGLDGGIDGGKGFKDTPGGLKLQNEGHQVCYKNIWIKELNLDGKDTDF